jgi:hypothetical protein
MPISSANRTGPVDSAGGAIMAAEPSFRRSFLVYGAGTVGRRLIGLLLIPIFTRALSPADYGVLALLGVFTAAYANLADLGISASIFRFYIQKKDEDGRRQVLSACAASLVSRLHPAGGRVSPAIARLLLADARPGTWSSLSMATSWLDLVIQVR